MLKPHIAPAINCKGRLLTFDRPRIMGILNVTPDSFYDGGRYTDLEDALRRAESILMSGADIMDIGAMSTRPGAVIASKEEEKGRILPVVEAISRQFPEAILSVDTFRSQVAAESIAAGAHIINDVSGGLLDEQMFPTIAGLDVPYILMHMRGTPATMQEHTDYDDVVNDIAVELGKSISALRQLGVKDIILDPGFGFAKTIAQNYELLFRVSELHYLGLPILGGISRKSMIYKKLNRTVEEALNGTTALNTLLLDRGVQILRVHDVAEAKQLIDLLCL